MFRKSSFCHSGGCVEVDTEFVRSSFCGGAENCVEVGAEFVKSSASWGHGDCVEVGAEFVSAAACGQGWCVEVAADESAGEEIVVRIRDSKQKDADGNHVGPVLEFTEAEWDAFLKGMDAGAHCEFRIKRPGGNGGNAEVGKTIEVACP